jgi:uncharacterized protein (TIGR02246 family)
LKTDDQAIRDLVMTWLDASKKGDVKALLSMLADDVIFMVPGQEPFGKDTFAANATKLKALQVEATSDIQELKILGEWAWMRNRLDVSMTPPDGKRIRRSGFTLTILRKTSDGNWVIARDANLLTPSEA